MMSMWTETVNPLRNFVGALDHAGIIPKRNLAAVQSGIISHGAKTRLRGVYP